MLISIAVRDARFPDVTELHVESNRERRRQTCENTFCVQMKATADELLKVESFPAATRTLRTLDNGTDTDK